MEIWKDVVGYEGIYEVSNIGNVRTNKDKVTYSIRHGERHWNQRVLKQKTDKNGYKRVSLWTNKKNKDWLVHRLVAIAFINNDNNYPMVNHMDAKPYNNHVENLEWCDSNHNVNHAFDNGLMKSKKVKLLSNDGEEFIFRSLTKASEFLGYNHSYLSHKIKKGNQYVDGYYIEIL